MGERPGSLRLSDMSLPGTHDTMTFTLGDIDPVDVISKTQTMTLTRQLESGIRAFDIRARHKNDKIQHSPW